MDEAGSEFSFLHLIGHLFAIAVLLTITGKRLDRGRRWLRDRSRSRLHQQGARAMRFRRGICRISERDISEINNLRAFVAEAIEVLRRCPKPDTFIGRKTQEPFPWEAETTADIVRQLS